MSRAHRRAGPTRGAGLHDELRQAGLRATAARVATLAALRRGGPVSHGEMEERVAGLGWNRTTVYRNLLDLVRAGLARRFDVGDHVWRFEAVAGEGGEEHPHFVCNSCGDIECLEDVKLAVPPAAGAPRALRDQRVDIRVHGVCDRCQ